MRLPTCCMQHSRTLMLKENTEPRAPEPPCQLLETVVFSSMNFFVHKPPELESYPLETLPLQGIQAVQEMSTLLSPRSPSSRSSAPSDALTAAVRQSNHLQRTLQYFLDSQSTGLSAGLGHTPSTPHQRRNSSPLSSSRRPGSTSRNPHQKSPIHSSTLHSHTRSSKEPATLSSARNGIHTTLLALARNKASEAKAHAASLEPYEAFKTNITRLDGKKKALEQQIYTLKSSTDHDQIAELGEEENVLQGEVRVLEEELAIKRARLRDVKLRKDGLSNKHEAKLSSWQRALEEVERCIHEEVLDERSITDRTGRSKAKDDIWAMPKSRRTVDMVKDAIESQIQLVREKKESAEAESEACAQGATGWKICAKEIGRVEQALRFEMARLRGGVTKERRTSSEGETTKNRSPRPDDTSGEGMQAVLGKMDSAIEELERQFNNAVERKWNPLICAIGAELEALREGRGLLEEAFGLSQVTLDGLKLERQRIDDDPGIQFNKEKINSSGPDATNNLIDASNDGEDSPSPDLLFSHTEDD